MSVELHSARANDAPAIQALIAANVEAGHLLPRTLSDVTAHAGRFLVVEERGRVIACGELAPLSRDVAEIRSLVVDEVSRGHGLGDAIVRGLRERAEREAVRTLCVFAHQPAYFCRLGFSIVPHAWLPEKIALDCSTCSLFRTCGQSALIISLRPRPS